MSSNRSNESDDNPFSPMDTEFLSPPLVSSSSVYSNNTNATFSPTGLSDVETPRENRKDFDRSQGNSQKNLDQVNKAVSTEENRMKTFGSLSEGERSVTKPSNRIHFFTHLYHVETLSSSKMLFLLLFP